MFNTESEDADKDADEIDKFGPYADLAVAFPLVIMNLTNTSGLIASKSIPNPNLTVHFGNYQHDLQFIYDKVDGFYTVLHASMDANDGPKYCPRHNLRNIKECIIIASCLIQTAVPEYIEMSHYASYMELMDRFIWQTWPGLETALFLERKPVIPKLQLEDEVPSKYQCDSMTHSHFDPVVDLVETPTATSPSLLQEDTAQTLLTSAMLGQAIYESHAILDSHMQNSSMEATIDKMKDVWRPICQKLECDHNNFWDTHYASHRQTVELMQASRPSALRLEIQKRLGLERRVYQFIHKHNQMFAAFLQSESQTGASTYFDFRRKSKTSMKSWHAYGKAGKAAMLRFVMPYMRVLSGYNETRATQSFDQEEFRKFREARAKTAGDQALASIQESPLQEGAPDRSGALLAKEFGLAEASQNSERRRRRRRRRRKGGLFGRRRRRKGGVFGKVKKAAKKAKKKAKKAVKTVKKVVKTVKKASEQTANIINKYGGIDKAMNSFKNKAQQFAQGVAKAGGAIAKITLDAVAYLETLFGCLGDLFEFIAIGYGKDLIPGALSFGFGTSATGGKASLENLLQGKAPTASISLEVGFSVGSNSPTYWGGLGVGGAVTCGEGGCGGSFSVGALASAKLPSFIPSFCPLGPIAFGLECSQIYGGGISAMCCPIDFVTGKTECR